MLITDEYRQQQKHLHETTVYGTASAQHAPAVAKIIDLYGVTKLLDYGAGSRLTLIRTISEKRLVKSKFDYTPYEPAIEKYSNEPEPSEMVACIDVLEHIEPDCLDDVLDHLKHLTLKIGYFTVHCGPAAKTLQDGRNAHLIQERPEWWLPRITDRFSLQSFQRTPDGFIVLVSPYGD